MSVNSPSVQLYNLLHILILYLGLLFLLVLLISISVYWPFLTPSCAYLLAF